MEDVEADALADVAYGLFEILLNKELCKTGSFLFEYVENGQGFKENLSEIFGGFREDYPQLGDALIERFGSMDAIYDLFCRGEGVIPTKTTQMYWIVQDAPGLRPDETDDEKAGKWLIFMDKNEADEMWRKIRNATCEGKLGISAKVSTAKPNQDSRDERIVIYVHTPDWEDEEGVMRIREELRALGIEQRIGYKRNLETYHGEYSEKGKKVTFYSA